MYECKLKVSRLASHRVLTRIESRASQELKEIPAGLVKNLGSVATDTLAHHFTEVLNGEPDLADWQCRPVRLVCKVTMQAS